MSGPKRIKGKDLRLTINGEEYRANVTSVELDQDEAEDDVTTFADAAAGGSFDSKFTVEAVTSTDPDSLWRTLWENAGLKGVEYVYAPHGNADPTPAEPHFVGTLELPGKLPKIGGKANETQVFEVELKCEQTPELVTA